MNLTRQAHYTWRHGEHLAKTEGLRFDYDLYRLHHFFVEVVYNLELGQVEHVEGFVNNDKLIQYVDELDISHLLQ